MNKIKEIFLAWKIALTVDENDPRYDLASKRIEICNSCEFKVETPIGPGISFYRCSICGCALKGKIFTPSTYKDEGGSCPKGFWSAIEENYLNKELSGTIDSTEINKQ